MLDEKISKRYKIMIVFGVSFASISLLGSIISSLIPVEVPEPEKMTPRERIAYVASNDFSRLAENEKVNYLKKIGKTRKQYRQVYRQLSPVERKKVANNTRALRRKAMKERMQNFFKMSPTEQEEHLENEAARIKARRANNKNSGQKRKNSSNGKKWWKGNRNARRARRYEQLDSTTRALRTEYRKRLHEKLKK